MTGIERLRDLANDYISRSWSSAGKMRGRLMLDIADQIERELRDALKSYTSGAAEQQNPSCADPDGAADVTSDAAKVTRGPAEDVSMSAYDLLPADDREAIAWVRDHGGLDSVKRLLDWVVGHCSTRQQLDFDFWLSGRVMYELGFEEDMADRDEVERRLLARLMPEGMEWLVDAWPRFEDDATLKFGEEAMGFSHKPPFVIDHVTLFDGGEVTVCAEADHDSGKVENFVRVLPGQRVKRPEPKVLDADGAETRVKETVFDKNTGEELIVTGFEDGRVWCEHRMTDADALPVRGMWSPGLLTHERPDSWERLEEDAENLDEMPCDYSAKDIVRRAKKLAGVSE